MTLKDIVTGGNYPRIELRTNKDEMTLDEFKAALENRKSDPKYLSRITTYAGMCAYKEVDGSGILRSLDGDTYYLNTEIVAFDSDPMFGSLVVYRYSNWGYFGESV